VAGGAEVGIRGVDGEVAAEGNVDGGVFMVNLEPSSPIVWQERFYSLGERGQNQDTHLRGFHPFDDNSATPGSQDEPNQSPITNHQSSISKLEIYCNHDSCAQCKRLRGSAFLPRRWRNTTQPWEAASLRRTSGVRAWLLFKTSSLRGSAPISELRGTAELLFKFLLKR
jgi:hypothetical protein